MLSLDTINALLFAVVLLDLVLGALLFAVGRKSAPNQVFALWMLALASWSFTIVAFFNADTSGEALMWMRAAYVEAIIAVMSFWYFSTQFPESRKFNRLLYVANMVPLAILCVLIMATPFIVVDVTGAKGAYMVHQNSFGWWVFAIYMVSYFLTAHALLVGSYIRAKGNLKRQLLYVIISVFFGVEIGGVFCNLLLPSPLFNNWDWIWLGPTLSTTIVVPFVAYAVYRYKLFTLRAMLTQILIVYTVALAFIDLVLARSLADGVIRGILAVFIAFLGWLVIARTEVEEAQRLELQVAKDQLEQANRHLKELDERKDEFISIASHQLRTPVSVMKGYLSLMQEGAYGPTPTYLTDKVDNMMLMNERLVQMIDNMLNVTRIEKNRLEYSCALVDVHPVLDQIVEQLQRKAATKGLVVTLGDVPTGPLVAYVDFEKLLEVLTNLVDNAIKYSNVGAIMLSAVSLPKKKSVVISVADQGFGMDLDTSKKIFQKFFRSSNPDVMVQGGTGLGLYVCAMFVRGMGGDIWIERTSPNVGTTISFALPTEPGGECNAPARKISPPDAPPHVTR